MCPDENNRCSENGECEVTGFNPIIYKCSCKDGYEGDGKECSKGKLRGLGLHFD